MRRFLTVLPLLTAALVHAQDITGVWQGHFHSSAMSERSSLLIEPRYKFEVQIAQTDKAFESVTYSYLSSIFYGKAAASGTVNPKNGKVLLQEGKLLEFRNAAGDDVCVMTCFLQYSRSGDEEFLEGSYVSMSVKDSSNCGRGTVFLRKVASSDFYKEPFLTRKEKEIEEENAEKEKDALKKPPLIAKKTTASATPKKTIPHPVKPAPGIARSTPATGVAKLAPAPGAAKSAPAPGVAKSTPAPSLAKVTPAMAKPTTGTAKPKPAASGNSKKPSIAADNSPTPHLSRVNTPNQPQPAQSRDSLSGTVMGKKFALVTPAVLLSRSNELIRTITVNTNEIELNIYDDGAIDHDSISVYLDKKQVISHAMISDQAIVLTLHMDDNNNYHELVMVAENEGDIPPNTSLMIVKAGDQRYEVRISSTMQKNAVILFKYEKPK